jgi:hypothetical protein
LNFWDFWNFRTFLKIKSNIFFRVIFSQQVDQNMKINKKSVFFSENLLCLHYLDLQEFRETGPGKEISRKKIDTQ